MNSLSEKRVAIVGLGLMGGSLGLALHRAAACREVWGIDLDVQRVARAQARGAISWGATDLGQGLRRAELVVLATPVRTILELLPRLPEWLAPGAMVIDLGSTKRAIVEAMERLPGSLLAIGGHPLCGRELSGIEAAEANLFQGAPFVLTPLSRSTPEARGVAEELIAAIGSRPFYLDADTHDHLVAVTSHLPYLAACALVRVAESVGADGPWWELAAGGFRDATRVAAGDLTMMLDILATNADQVIPFIDRLEQELGKFRMALATDLPQLRARLEVAQLRRRSLS